MAGTGSPTRRPAPPGSTSTAWPGTTRAARPPITPPPPARTSPGAPSASDFESRHARDIVDGRPSTSTTATSRRRTRSRSSPGRAGRWRLFGDAQLRWARFRYEGSLDLGEVDWTFFNPKAGAAVRRRPRREPLRVDRARRPRAGEVGHAQGRRQPDHPVRARRRPARKGGQRRDRGEPLVPALHGAGERIPDGLPRRDRADGRTVRDWPAASPERGPQLTARPGGGPDVAPGEPLRLRHTATYSRNRIDSWTQFYDVYDDGRQLGGSTSRDHHDVPPYVTPGSWRPRADYAPTAGPRSEPRGGTWASRTWTTPAARTSPRRPSPAWT